MERAERAIAKIGNRRPFLFVYYGSDGAGGWQRIGAVVRNNSVRAVGVELEAVNLYRMQSC